MADTAAEALAVLQSPKEIDLLLTRMVMPGSINGRQLVDMALRRRSALKVLFTAVKSQGTIDNHGQLDAGALVLEKPYRKSDLARMLRAAIAA